MVRLKWRIAFGAALVLTPVSVAMLVVGQIPGSIAGSAAAGRTEPASPEDGGFVAAAPGRIEGTGDVMPVGTAATAVVQDLLVKEGDRVSAGQILVQLDCRIIEHETHAREAELAQDAAILAKLTNGARAEEIAIAAASVRTAEARAEEAEKERRRVDALKDGFATTRVRIDQAERDARATAGQLDQERERLAMLQAGARTEDVAEAKARQSAAAAKLAQSRVRLEQCAVRAPINGVVLSTHVTTGQFIGPMFQGPVVRIVDDREQRVRAEVDERDLRKVCIGQQAVIAAEGFPGEMLNGAIIRINPGMGRRTILGTDPAEKSDRDVREVVLTTNRTEQRWPIGFRVLVRFQPCPSFVAAKGS